MPLPLKKPETEKAVEANPGSTVASTTVIDKTSSDVTSSSSTTRSHAAVSIPAVCASILSKLRKGKKAMATGHEKARAVSDSKFPMYVAKVSDLLKMTAIEAHQELLSKGVFHEYKPGMKVVFISHQWTSWQHPDRTANRLRVLQDIFRGLKSGDVRRLLCPFALVWRHTVTPIIDQGELQNLADEGYVWYDYFCVPQPSVASAAERATTTLDLRKAVESIPSYLEHCQSFCMLVPPGVHTDSKAVMDMRTYLDRGWCRAEIAAWSLTGRLGKPGFWAWASGFCAECGIIHWLLFPPGQGEFSLEEDRKLVDALIGRMLDARIAEALDEGELTIFSLLKAIKGHYTLDGARPLASLQEWLKDYRFESAHRWRDGWHAIHFAALEGNADILQSLVAISRVSADKKTRRALEVVASLPGMAPCHICAFYLPTQLAIECLEVLKNLGANLMMRDVLGHTALHYACMQSKRQPLIQYLLDAGCALDCSTAVADTALSVACQCGRVDTACCLLEHGAAVQFSNVMGVTPLMLASICGCTELVRVLLDGKADVNHTPGPRRPSLTKIMGKILMRLRPDALVSHLVQGSSGRTPLMVASMGGNIDTVKMLLDAGADTKAVNSRGEDARYHAEKYSRVGSVVDLLAQYTDQSMDV
eukprot:TRINITY_DN47317_c0_g1_i1.p1 TRINITY_DN47317_c0_g1~~TRINITY_DN47317_c0_g1_i1.p1  ORF type:complete len:647 (+),score=96.54 TRINITY_DN47317_c0_g1_i1:230-2170(+)